MKREAFISLVEGAYKECTCGAANKALETLIAELLTLRRRSAGRQSVTEREIQLGMAVLIDSMKAIRCPVSPAVSLAFYVVADINPHDRRKDRKRPADWETAAFCAGWHLAETGKRIGSRALSSELNQTPTHRSRVGRSTAAKWLKETKFIARIDEWRPLIETYLASRREGTPKRN